MSQESIVQKINLEEYKWNKLLEWSDSLSRGTKSIPLQIFQDWEVVTPVPVSGQRSMIAVKGEKRRMDRFIKFCLSQTKNVNVLKEGKVRQLVKSAARCN